MMMMIEVHQNQLVNFAYIQMNANKDLREQQSNAFVVIVMKESFL